MKKTLLSLAVVLCLFSGAKAFTQCIVSGGNFKGPVTYQSIEEMKKNLKTLKKAAKKSEIEIKIPLGSSLRNTNGITAIFEEVFNDSVWKRKSGNPNPYLKEERYSNILVNLNNTIELANLQKSDICFYITLESDIYNLKRVSGLETTQYLRDLIINMMKKDLDCSEKQFGIIYNSKDREDKRSRTVNAAWDGTSNLINFLREVKNSLNIFESVKIDSVIVFPEKSNKRDSIKNIVSQLGYTINETNFDEKIKMSRNDIEIHLSCSDKLATVSRGLMSLTEYESAKKKLETDSPKINELVENGKKFEAQKRYFYALASYYEAANIEWNDKIEGEGLKNYIELREIIQKGLPGKEEYDEFSIRDGWIALIKDAERYFSEYPNFEIYFLNLNKSNLNYEKKTANYTFSTILIRDRYTILARGVLIQGLNNYDSSQLPYVWCNYDISRYSYRANKTSIINVKNLVEEDFNKIRPEIKTKLIPEINKIYNDNSIALFVKAGAVSKYDGESIGFSFLNNLACFDTIPSINFQKAGNIEKNGIDTNYFSKDFNEESLYEVKFGLFDKDGKLIAETSKQSLLVGDSLFSPYDRAGSYTFEDISSENMKKIDNGEYTIKVLGLWLRYGVFDIRSNQAVANKKISKDELKKNLSEIQIDINKVTFGNWTKELSDTYDNWGR